MFKKTETIFEKTETIFKKTDIIFKKTETIFEKTETIFKKTETIFKKTETIFKKTDAIFKKTDIIFEKTDTIFKKTDALIISTLRNLPKTEEPTHLASTFATPHKATPQPKPAKRAYNPTRYALINIHSLKPKERKINYGCQHSAYSIAGRISYLKFRLVFVF